MQLSISRKRLLDYLIPITIICILLTLSHLYQLHSKHEMDTTVQEFAELLKEPLWNFDSAVVDGFVSVISARKENLKIQIFDQDERLVSESMTTQLIGLDKLLFDLHLLQIRDIHTPVYKSDQNIGEIVLRWKDPGIYYYANGCLVALLLYTVINLYRSVRKANEALQDNIDDLHGALTEVKKQRDYIEHLYNVLPEGLLTIDKHQKPVDWNHSFEHLFQIWAKQFDKDETYIQTIILNRLLEAVAEHDAGEFTVDVDNINISVSFKSSTISNFNNLDKVISFFDITDMVNMSRRLAQTEKLESVGRLAAGIAHEINTPTQYVITNVDFLSEALEDLISAFHRIEEIAGTTSADQSPDFRKGLKEVFEEADLDYLKDEIPAALTQSAEGLDRIKSIVSAMKTFSHPSGTTVELCDLNQAIDSTVTVTGNEWKYVADMELHLTPDLPPVPCFLDQFNQVVLNIIINSVHAIEEKNGKDGGSKGKIEIHTRKADDYFELEISDNGIGMPQEIKERIFDPFFTTKAVNKGTGQGLAIANDVIVNKHNGSMKVVSTEGKGTTFVIRLPYTVDDHSPQHAIS